MAAYKSLLEACQKTVKDKATLGLYFFGELLKQVGEGVTDKVVNARSYFRS